METVHPEVRSLFARTARGLRPPIVGEKAFTDDRAPVEWLIDRSLVSLRRRRRLDLPGALDEHRDALAVTR